MKRFLSLLFVFAGIFLAQTAFAQTPADGGKKKDKKADTPAATKKSDRAPAPGSGTGNAGGITIDESGTPKVKSKGQQTTAPNTGTPATTPTPKKEAESPQSSQRSSSASPAPAPIAIDESGPSKVPQLKAGASDSITAKPVPQTGPPR